MSRRILITAAGAGPSNNLMRSLMAADAATMLVGVNADRFVLKKSPAQRNFLTPLLAHGDGTPSPEAPRVLASIVDKASVDLIVPGNDRDARALALLRDGNALPARTFLPRVDTIDLCHDKCALSLFLRERGIPAPRTYPLTDRASVAQAWKALDPRDLAWCRMRRGFASRGATKVRDAEQAWHWISYWHTMRGVALEEFTLCEFLPGRDYNVQALWSGGRPVLVKMCERLSYLNADQHASGMASTPALAKTVWVPAAIEACAAALRALDPEIQGIFSIDLKENAAGVPCITEINAGRFAMITNLYDFTGEHSMAGVYVRVALGEPSGVEEPHEHAGEKYLVRELDALPGIFDVDELSDGIERGPGPGGSY